MSFGRGFGGLMGGGGNPIVGGGLLRIAASYSGLRTDTRKAMMQMRADLKAGTAGLSEGSAGARQLGRDVQNTTKHVSLLGTALKGVGVALGVTVIGGLAMSVKAAIDFENAMAGVAKTTGASEQALTDLGDQFRALSKTIPTTATQLAKIGEAGGALGIPTENLRQFVKVVATIGTTTNVSVDEAATALGQLSNVLSLTQADYEKFASTLVNLGNTGASTEKDILEVTRRFGATGRLLGLTTEQILSLSSAAANLGMQPQIAATSLMRLSLRLNQISASTQELTPIANRAGMSIAQLATTAMNGGKGFSDLQKKLGMTSKSINDLLSGQNSLSELERVMGVTDRQFQSMKRTDPSQIFVRLFEGMNQMSSIDRTNFIKDLLGPAASAGGGSGMTRLMLGLADSVDRNLVPALQNGTAAWNNFDAAQQSASKRWQTTSSQLQLLQNTLNDIFISIGQTSLPVLVDLFSYMADNLPKAAKALGDIWKNDLEEPLTALWKALMNVIGALGSIILDWGPGGTGSGIAGGLNVAATAAGVLANALTTALNVMTALLSNPVIAGLGKLVVAFTALRVGIAALSGIRGIVGGLAGAAARGMGMGRFLGPGAAGQVNDPAAQAQMTAAGEQVTAAKMQLEAAGKAGMAASTLNQESFAAAMHGTRQMPGWTYDPVMGWTPNVLTAGTVRQRPQDVAGYLARPGTNSPLFNPEGRLITGEGVGQRGLGTQLGNNTLFGEQGMLTAVALEDKAAYLKNAAIYDNAGRGIIRNVYGHVEQALQNTVRPALSGLGGLASGAFSLIGKAFWPLLIADMVGTLLQQPIADMFRKDPGMQRVADAWTRGWMEGLGATLQSASEGTDAFVGRPGSYKIGGVDVPTDTIKALAKPLDATDPGTAEQARKLMDAVDGAKSAVDLLAASQKLGQYMKDQLAGQQPDVSSSTMQDYIQRMRDVGTNLGVLSTADNEALTAFSVAVNDRDPNALMHPDAAMAALEKVKAAIRAKADGMVSDALSQLSTAVWGAMQDAGIKVSGYQLQKLTPAQLQSLGNVFTNTPAGADQATIDLMQRFATRQAVGPDFTVGAHPGLSGAQGIVENLLPLAQSFKGLDDWRKQQITALGPDNAANLQGLVGMGRQMEIADTSKNPQARKSVLEALGFDVSSIKGTGKAATAALNQMWAQAWQGFMGAKKLLGYDQQETLANQTRDVLTQALKDGVDLTSASRDIPFSRLFDGIGFAGQDIAKRISEALRAAIPAGISGAKDTTAFTKWWNSMVPDSMKIGGAGGGQPPLNQTLLRRHIAEADAAGETGLAASLRRRLAAPAPPSLLPNYGPIPGLPGAPHGLLHQGNLDLNHRPVYRNKDGSISTVRSISVGTDSGEVLIPTVWRTPDGKVHSDTSAGFKKAIAHYKATGENLGTFADAPSATAYAKRLHGDQAKLYNGKAPPADADQKAKAKEVMDAVLALFADDIKNADTAPEQNDVVTAVNKLMPKNGQMTWAQIAASLKDPAVQKVVDQLAAFGNKTGADASAADPTTQVDTLVKQLAADLTSDGTQKVMSDAGASALGYAFAAWPAQTTAALSAFRDTISKADTGSVAAPTLPDLTGPTGKMIQTMIDAINAAVGDSPDANTPLNNALHQLAGRVKTNFPQSPVRYGPLKGGVLARLGRNTVREIARGFGQVALSPNIRMPHMGGGFAPPMPALASGAGGGPAMSSPQGWQVPPMGGGGAVEQAPPMAHEPRPLFVQNMSVYGPNDEASILQQLSFADPSEGSY